MIVRESPKSKVKTNQPTWPPRSPAEALLSSPSGRRKYEKMRERSSVSPSPSKRRPAPPDDDEDEETLQLQLQAIQAKLKLKALQKKKAIGDEDVASHATSSRANTAMGLRKMELPRHRPDTDIEVPHSPIRIRQAPEEQRSPARVVLGIDKGLTARDISLKRPRSAMSGGIPRTGSTREATATPKIKSFSERIAESRTKEKERGQSETRLEQRRNRGFGLHNIDGLKDRPVSRTESSLSSDIRTSQDMPPPASKTLNRAQSRSTTDLRNPPTPRPTLNRAAQSDSSRPPVSTSKPISGGVDTTPTLSKYAEISQRDNSSESASFEALSGLHLKSREMQHNVVTRALEGKTIFTIPQLLKVVKSPNYEPPDEENDYVVLGVIGSKSEPLQTKNAARDQSKGNQEKGVDQNGGFMVIHLTDLKWNLDLFLFDTGFSRFWKLPVGTLVAILNPDIMPPRNRDSGKFSLKLSSSDDTILEIGIARDLDICHAKWRDGKGCSHWIDSRKTEYCEDHVEMQVAKAKKGRMEVNTMTGYGRGPSAGGMFSGRRGGPKRDELKREGQYHDRELHETMYIAPPPGGSARLIDRDRQSWEGGANREERHRKQLAEREKERELAKKLGKMGEGTIGGDYMKLKDDGAQKLPARGYTSAQGSTGVKPTNPVDVDYSSLLNRTSADVSLAPVKRKRIASGKSSASSDPVGWAFKYGRIPSPKKDTGSALRTPRESSPVKKKARLLLPEKGIREPGRESLGGLDVGLIAAMDEDDDDLEIV